MRKDKRINKRKLTKAIVARALVYCADCGAWLPSRLVRCDRCAIRRVEDPRAAGYWK